MSPPTRPGRRFPIRTNPSAATGGDPTNASPTAQNTVEVDAADEHIDNGGDCSGPGWDRDGRGRQGAWFATRDATYRSAICGDLGGLPVHRWRSGDAALRDRRPRLTPLRPAPLTHESTAEHRAGPKRVAHNSNGWPSRSGVPFGRTVRGFAVDGHRDERPARITRKSSSSMSVDTTTSRQSPQPSTAGDPEHASTPRLYRHHLGLHHLVDSRPWS